MIAFAMAREPAMELPFQQVDVFTAVPFQGNPVAVVLAGDALTGEQMQAIARWTNLSETTFVCMPQDPRADYRLRIFTPQRELPFAGHPTIGSAHAVLRHGHQPRVAGRLVQECARGLIDIKIDGDDLFLALPEPCFAEATPELLAAVAGGLGIAGADILRAASVDVGPVWLTVQLPDGDAVRALRPDMGKLAALNASGVTGVNVFGLYVGGDSDLEVRSFAPADGIPEDPVCGSGNGCVAALVRRDGLLPGRGAYTARQGRCLGRDGRIDIQFESDTIWLGGRAVTCVDGTLSV
jgi:PhzF family phenazine biosynthesis protein